MRVTAVLAVMVTLALSGCSSDPNPPAGRPTTVGSAPTATPTLPATVASALAGAPGDVKGGATGDLAVALAGDCLIRRGDDNSVWLRLELSANWVGATFPAVGYRVTADSGSVASGDLKAPGPFVAAINGTGFLGRDVVLTVNVDAAGTVAEVNEANNVLRLTVTTPASAPSGDADYVVACR